MTPLESLHDALLDGGLDETQQRELAALLADPEQRRAWRRLATLGGQLAEELSGGSVARLVVQRAGAVRPLRPRWYRPMALALAAAVLVAVVLGGWRWVGDRAPAAPATPAAPAAPGAVVAEGTLRAGGATFEAGSALPAAVPLIATASGALVLADGGRIDWSGPAGFALTSAGAVGLIHGDVRVDAGAALTVTTPFASATMANARCEVVLGDRDVNFGAEAGDLAVLTGDRLTRLVAGQALTVSAGGVSAPRALRPPSQWSSAAGSPDWGASGWLGRLEGGDLIAMRDPDDDAADLRRYVRTGEMYCPGLVAMSPDAVFRATITSFRPGGVTIMLVTKDPLTEAHLGNYFAKAALDGLGSAQTISVPLSAFTGKRDIHDQPRRHERQPAIYNVVLQWWGDDLGSRVRSLSIAP